MPRFPYQFFDEYVVRSPLFSLKDFIEKTDRDEIPDEVLREICTDPVFQEAVYLASPYLHGEILKWLNSEGKFSSRQHEKLKDTVLKYYSRMSTRCTPFGLFSGVGLGTFNTDISTSISNNQQPITNTQIRDTKLDMHFLVALSETLAKIPEIKSKLLFYPNTSIYRVGSRIRYVEYTYAEGKREYVISSAPNSKELNQLLKFVEKGKTIVQITETLINDEITEEDAAGFIEELIENQVLVSELEPNVSGVDFLDAIIAVVQKFGARNYADILVSIQKKLEHVDMKFGNSVSLYAEVEELMKFFNINYEQKYLFQTDLYFNNTFQLPITWKKELKKAITFVNRMTLFNKDTVFETFKKAFYERFETEEVPLTYVLDTEIGIGYKQNIQTKGLHPYLEDINLPGKVIKPELNLRLNPVQIILNKKIQDNLLDRAFSIELREDDFKNFEEHWEDLSDTLSFMTEIVSDSGQEKLFFNGGGGSSAGDLLARFCSEKSEIKTLVKAIAEKEKALNPDVISAEIVHLPEARIGNVIRRPLLREYEIPYLAQSALPQEKQISVEDLYISIKNDRIVLRSKRLNKEVEPYLTNAHNYSADSLPVYHFLCDLYSQHKRSGLSFYWGDLRKIYRFLPRVEYKNIILSKARWKINEEDINMLLSVMDSKDEFLSALKTWRVKRQMPKWIQWAQSDNTLVLNLENYTSATLFITTIQGRKSIRVEEFLYHEKEDFARQFVFSLYKDQ
ncbi:lantibiotic dehydratase family protein [Chryseobacterium sp. SIMBA_029]|uniref:lantibiotic dehydratase family protein n=1 Tax=Chryseobacterium sp. SIMBA_029 TaxID=3085772 RepID=UPI00397A2827